MPTLENDRLVFRFPQVEEEARFSIDFQRTFRIPDSEETYWLPPGLGRFPLRHAADHVSRLPANAGSRGGVFLPMWQSEAMWISFRNVGPAPGLHFPVAVKIAAGKINAVTGDAWRNGLQRDPQDYLVSPEQPWLDGYAVERGVIRQFVAMPLGEGYSAEEQLTGQAEWGGLQVSVIPLRKDVWQARREAWEREQQAWGPASAFADAGMVMASCEMGLAPGGRMHQSIEPDPFQLEDWDTTAADRVFVTLLHARGWKAVTGEPAPEHPPTAQDYARARLPWFACYGTDQALPGSATLGSLKSAGALHKDLTGAALPHSADVKPEVVVPAGPRPERPRPVAGGTWDD